MEDTFNPLDWIEPNHPTIQPSPKDPQSFNPSIHQSSSDISTEVDLVISRIEADLTDITTSYQDWLNVGFAFANEFGEGGRSFFHRVSRFYSGYTKADSDKQFDHCLKANGHGITIRTFFHMARQAGVDVKSVGSRDYRDNCGATMYRGRTAIPAFEGTPNASEDAGRAIPSARDGRDNSGSNLEQQVSLVPSDQSVSPSEDDAPSEQEQPTLPDYLFDQVPDFFQRVVSRADSKEERDILFLGSIVALGSCLTTFSGSYDGNTVYPSLFLYIAAKASSGKGRLIMCRNLVNPIHWEKRKQNEQENQQYDMETREYNSQKNKDSSVEKPVPPPVRLHFIPANNSTAGFLQLIGDNDGEGLILETEGDTIAQALKTDFGNFSDALRKGFHHEIISCYRKTDRVHLAIEHPRFSMILSSTIGQLKNLIPSTENGLSSRFIFYYMNLRPNWKDVFAHSNDKSLAMHFDELGQDFFSLYKLLRATDPIEFRLTGEQQDEFNAFFTQMQDKYLVLQGLDYLAIIRRLGLIAFRIMMILTAMRIPETGDFSVKQECGDEDFQSTLAIIKTMVRHASYIVSQLPEEAKTEKRGNRKEMFYEGLPAGFTYKEMVALAKRLAIQPRTAERYIKTFCDKGLIYRDQQGFYINKNNTENEDKK